MRLTRRQREILDFLTAYIARNGFAPTLEEIADHFGLASLATVHKHLKNLEAKGAIQRDWNHGRAMEVVSEEEPGAALTVPLLGEVAAGLPIEAIVDAEPLPIPAGLFGDGVDYALRARGWSMVDEQIRDGDLLLIQECRVAERGALVIALVDGSAATVKRLYPEGEWVRLQPANEEMEPIRVEAERVRIQGVVRGVIRRLG
jgi:repressor LexA